jgi:predicted phage terminase large subunit-like protein
MRDKAWAREHSFGTVKVRIEEEPGSSGKALIDRYRRTVLDGYALRGDKVSGSKQTRAEPMAARVEAGDVYMCRGSWNDAFLDEAVLFPVGDHDDQIDALAGAFNVLSSERNHVVPMPISIMKPWDELGP